MKRLAIDFLEEKLAVRVSRPGRSMHYLEQDFLKQFFDYFEVDCVFDVGANIGQYAEKLRSKIGFKGPIISFEPNPEAAASVRSLSKGDDQWFLEQVALDETVRDVSFNVMVSSQFSSLAQPSTDEVTLLSDLNKVAREISVTTGTVEQYYNEYRKKLNFKRPFLKMDTQGFDVAVAKGCGASLPAFVGLQSELSFKKIYADTLYYYEAISFYEQAGFELSGIIPNNRGHFPILVEMDCVMFNPSFLRSSSDQETRAGLALAGVAD